MSITIGSVTLDDKTYSPTSNISYEFFKTQSGEIIGGHVIANIQGKVSIEDKPGQKTGSQVMALLKSIRDLGKTTQCIDVVIPNFNTATGKAKIENVTIEEGPDPTWVNQGAFSIQVRGLIDKIQENSFNIVATDGVQELSLSESIEIGEDSHGYVYDSSANASKAFVKFKNSVTLKCEPMCSNVEPMDVLKKIYKVGPTKAIFQPYKNWTQYLESRSLDISTDGSITFNCDMILTPPGTNSTGALVDLQFDHNKTYETKDITYITKGSVVGLARASWSDVIDLGDSCSATKLGNALGVFSQIKGKYGNLNNWGGQKLELEEKPDCPEENDEQIGRCEEGPDEGETDSDYIKPSNSTTSVSRTDGSINFSFEWSTTKDESGSTCLTNGVKTETTIDITERKQNYVLHEIPLYGTLIQNLDCFSAKRLSITVSVTYPEDSCGQESECEAEDGLEIAYEDYLNDGTNWLMIKNSHSETINSYIISQDFIECRA